MRKSVTCGQKEILMMEIWVPLKFRVNRNSKYSKIPKILCDNFCQCYLLSTLLVTAGSHLTFDFWVQVLDLNLGT